mgnify:CR=1 FL=1
MHAGLGLVLLLLAAAVLSTALFRALRLPALLGYVAASSGPQTPAQAETSRLTVSEEKPSPTPAPQVPCCDAKLTRTSAIAESIQVADASSAFAAHNLAVATTAQTSGKKPNILVLWGDDIGVHNISAYNHGIMGYRTPNIDRIVKEGALFTDAYSQQSCTAGRASFILGQHPFRTGLLTIGMPGSPHGIPDWTPTTADLLKEQGYTTGQFGKNHLGDQDKHLPTLHGFDEFFGNLYHLNAEEEPEQEPTPHSTPTAQLGMTRRTTMCFNQQEWRGDRADRSAEEQRDALATLCSRPSLAHALLDAIETDRLVAKFLRERAAKLCAVWIEHLLARHAFVRRLLVRMRQAFALQLLACP